MAAYAQSVDEPYQELAGYSWTEEACGMLERDQLHGDAISCEGIVRSRVWGRCRCGQALDDRQSHTAVTVIMSAELRVRLLRESTVGGCYYPGHSIGRNELMMA